MREAAASAAVAAVPWWRAVPGAAWRHPEGSGSPVVNVGFRAAADGSRPS
ncbi:hypothetical protein [Streptomyces erythrochromogenes]